MSAQAESHLAGKNILLAITGSIAAYKAALLTRLLIKSGSSVQVLMSESATSFIAPLTLSTLSKRPVLHSIQTDQGWNNHVDLGLWADALVIAPCTANTLAKIAHGHCDNIINATYLSARCPTFIAPAMDVDMWHHSSTQRNLTQAQSDGCSIIPVTHGELASGLIGEGRMAEPEAIQSYLEQYFAQASAPKPLAGKKILITAGPTHEAIDPVRFIGNRSTGKMGIALAEIAAAKGAQVNLVLGPTSLTPKDSSSILLHRVTSAQEMYKVSTALWPASDAAIMAAAVADYKPKHYSGQKIKKQDGNAQLELERTKDIAATLGQQKKPHQLLVGFALETQNEVENATRKLQKKNFDFIVLNSLNDPGAGFGHDTNKVRFLLPDNIQREFKLQSKTAVASDILDQMMDLWDIAYTNH